MTKKAITLLSTSERTCFVRCRAKWNWHYNEGWSADLAKPALRFGDLIHQSLAVYYKPGKTRGVHPATTFKKLYRIECAKDKKFGIRDESGEWADAGEMGVEVLTHYVDHYGKDLGIEIVAPEMPFKVKLIDVGGKPFYYVGRFDAVYRSIESGEYGLLEHKTAGTISIAHLEMDEQASSYWAFAPLRLRELGLLNELGDLDLVLYNFLRKAKKDPRPQNAEGLYLNKPTKEFPEGAVSKVQPPPYFHREPVFRDEFDRKRVLLRIRQQAWEMRMVREGKLPIYKSPMTMFGSNCGDCEFADVCELHETGSDYKSVLNMTFHQGPSHTETYYEELFGKEAKKSGR